MQDRLPTSIRGLDEILQGGFIANRAYLVRGGPGSGKTTLGLHFLAAAAQHQESSLFISLGETTAQIQDNASRIGLDIGHVEFLDLSPTSDVFTEIQAYDIFSPAEVEREPTTQRIMEKIQTLHPRRVFLDAMTQFRYLATDPFQFRKQVLAFLRFLTEQGATVLFTSESSPEAPDEDLQFMSDGVIHLENLVKGRSLRVSKFRGSGFRDGYHSMQLSHTGMEVFPRLLPEAYKQEFTPEPMSSGIPELDELLHGGIERGTITFINGPSGVGKTTISLQFMKEAAGRGDRSVVYSFEEEVEIILRRCESVSIPARAMIERDMLSLVKVEPLRFSPDAFADLVRQEVEEQNAKIVMIDSISGYQLALRGEDLVGHLHALCKYLANVGVTVILVNETANFAGEFQGTRAGITYLADNFIYMRYLERYVGSQLEVRKAIGVLKKRLSDFEKTLRELQITRYGLKVGQPMSGLRGIFSDMPQVSRPSENGSNV